MKNHAGRYKCFPRLSGFLLRRVVTDAAGCRRHRCNTRFSIFYDVVGMFAEVAPLYLQSLGIGSYDTAVVQGVILRLWGTGMERACGAAFLQCRFMNPFGNVCQRHHAAEGEGQYEDAEKIPLT